MWQFILASLVFEAIAIVILVALKDEGLRLNRSTLENVGIACTLVSAGLAGVCFRLAAQASDLSGFRLAAFVAIVTVFVAVIIVQFVAILISRPTPKS